MFSMGKGVVLPPDLWVTSLHLDKVLLARKMKNESEEKKTSEESPLIVRFLEYLSIVFSNLTT